MKVSQEDLKDLVVMINPDTGPFSHDPRWHIPEVREAWINSHDEQGRELDGEVSEEVTDEDDYNSWTNDELRAELSERKLDISGKKAEMVARLEEDDAKGA